MEGVIYFLKFHSISVSFNPYEVNWRTDAQNPRIDSHDEKSILRNSTA